MAERPVFFTHRHKAVSRVYSFEWFPGFAVSQKQRSIESLHHAVLKTDADARPLEVSTKSKDAIGVKLSAFHLRLNGHTFENVFQSAKVFENGGPYPDLLQMPPQEAKRDKRLRDSGGLVAFYYQGETFPLIPQTVFYDYIYMAAVRESLPQVEIRRISEYTCFTDIEFNPKKSINTQARTVSMMKLLLDEYKCLPDFSKEEFIQYHRKHVVF